MKRAVYYEGVVSVMQRSRVDVWKRLAQLKKRGYRIGDLVSWATHLCPEPSGKDIEYRALCK
jgi:hypothetical protein